MRLWFLVFLLAVSATQAEIIPSTARTAPWAGNVGVPGGIPHYTTIYANAVTDLGCDPTGGADISTILYDTIQGMPTGENVIYLPAGTYNLAARVQIAAGKKGIVLRGAGMGQTIIRPSDGAGNAFFLVGSSDYPYPAGSNPITAGATRGSTSIVVSDDLTYFVAGKQFVISSTTNPTYLHRLGGFADSSTTLAQTCNVVSKVGSTITFDPPLVSDFPSCSAVAFSYTPSSYIGFEDMTFDLDSEPATFCAVEWDQVYACWIKNVEVSHPHHRQMYMSSATRCEIRGSYFHDTTATGPNTEGLDFAAGASYCLIENNIFNNGGAMAVIFGDANGSCVGNAVSYNYFVNAPPGWWDISFSHGCHDMFNLAEGNILDWFKDDGYFGSASHNTLFRNRIYHRIQLKHLNNYYNVIGNVLGKLTDTTIYKLQNTSYEQTASDYDVTVGVPVYELGFPNIGNQTYTGSFAATSPPDYSALDNILGSPDNQKRDLNVSATLVRKGNYNLVDAAIPVSEALSGDTYADSVLYPEGAPDWWTDDDYVGEFPPIEATDPNTFNLPAKQRYEALSDPTPTPGVPDASFRRDQAILSRRR
jgi:hypothetical protein